MIWQPTPELRWVLRLEMITSDTGRRVPVLQQKWFCQAEWGDLADEEWRDVPVVKEEK